MAHRNIRQLLEEWEELGWLNHVKEKVSPIYELGRIVHEKKGKEPFLFHQVEGYEHKLIAGIAGDREKVAHSLGVTVEGLIPRIMESVVHPIAPHVVEKAPVHEHVIKNPVNLEEYFPIPQFHEKDSGQYYVSGILVVKDLNGNNHYTSIRRMQYLGGNRTNILITSPVLMDQYKAYERQGKRMEIAVMFGVSPAIILSSQMSTHLFQMDKFALAGGLIRESIPLVKCKTVDLYVCAEAEIVLEGHMLPFEREEEGPFGELAGYYGDRKPQPIVEITGITFRNQPICQTIFPSSYEERLSMAITREATLLSTVRQVVPGVKQVHITMGGVARYHAIIQIEKRHEGDGKQAALAAFASDKDLKHVVVVNEDVDLFDLEDVEWAIATRVQGDLDVFIIPGANGSPLESSHALRGVSAKIGIDATYPLAHKEMFLRTSIPDRW